LRNTGEFPVEISGPDAEAFINHVFVRSVSALKVGRCIYNFFLYYDGGMITDGVMLRLEANRFWIVQADSELTKWYNAHAQKFDTKARDPNVWVTQVQGPNSFGVLSDVIDGDFPELWQYFGIATVRIADDDVIILRIGFSNELGWEFYLRPENNAEKIGNRK
jgi:aminomethyltransferase|tara:strand:+ start:818 stop:1306 length:489 start_codon:yes stop_codon:yes gene_type:complete